MVVVIFIIDIMLQCHLGNGTYHHVPEEFNFTSNFTTHFKSGLGGGTTDHHGTIDNNVNIGTTTMVKN